jgi:phosphoribosylformylglycinamidine synthase subunit PurQ / glutaminase
MPEAIVIRAAGTNCDAEMVRAFELAGARCELVHLDRLAEQPAILDRFDLIGFPGGFSYGDDVASGRIFALRLKLHVYPALRDAARRGAMIIGACNGFQVLVQAGLLPGPEGEWPEATPPAQEVALTFNAGGSFIDRWLRMEPVADSVCVWTRGLAERFAGSRGEQALWLPIAHGEGRLVARSPAVLERLRRNGQIAIRYHATDNANGSEDGIAGICDRSGRIFGLMPHPERYLEWNRHPWWTRMDHTMTSGPTPGLMVFQNAVAAVRAAPPVRPAPPLVRASV